VERALPQAACRTPLTGGCGWRGHGRWLVPQLPAGSGFLPGAVMFAGAQVRALPCAGLRSGLAPALVRAAGLDDGWHAPPPPGFNLLLQMSWSAQLPSARPKIIAFLLHCFECVSSKCLICALA